MQSIKTKFTIIFTATIFIIILLFSLVIYIFNVVTPKKPIEEEIRIIGENRPIIRYFIEETPNMENLKNMGDEIRAGEIKRYTNTLLMIIPPTLVISALIAYYVASYLVKPIEEISKNISLINSTNLSKRIPVTHNSDEIETLTLSFNSLLDELEEAFKSQEQFIQDAAHELRTPISTIKSNLEVFDQIKHKSTKDYAKLIGVVKNLNQKLESLNEKLLFLNRKTKNSIQYKKVNINDLLEDTYENLAMKAKQKNVQVNFDFKKQPIFLQANPVNLALAMKNLLDNSIKYSKKSGAYITITTDMDEKYIYIKFKDNGIGIAKKDLCRIFDRFYRGSNVTNVQGEGLGLSIVKKVIEAHKGDVEVKSQIEQGSEFSIKLPILKT